MSRKGFTLIELLIVIAILGILVSLILPRFGDVRENANVNVCVANIRGLVSAMNIYEVKENVGSSWDWTGKTETDLVDWGYLADEPRCPEATTAADDDYTLSTASGVATAVCTINGTDHVWP